VRVRDVGSFVAFAMMIAFAISYMGSLGLRIGPPPHRTNVSMMVSDINSLVVGSNVLLRGVPVGKVSNITSSVEGATVDFYIENRYRVPVDSDVRLANLSALGESYIGLVPRSQSGPMLREGQRIATDNVIQPPSISELTASVVRVVNQLDPDALKRIIAETDAALPDPISTLPNLTHASTLLRNTAADMKGHGRALIENFDTLLGNATWVGPVLANLIAPVSDFGVKLQQAFQASYPIVYGGAPTTLYLVNRFFDRLLRFLDNNSGDLQVLGEALLPKIKGIAGAMMNFDTGQILANFLATLPEDGTITLHVRIPES